MSITEMTLRPINIEDGSLVLDWRNSPAIRGVMSDQSAISDSDHEIWLEKTIRDSTRIALLVLERETPVGFVQFHLLGPEVAEWGFYKSPSARQGLGRAICLAGISWCRDNLTVSTIIAKVIQTNEVSLGLHTSLGFKLISETQWTELSGESGVPDGHSVFKMELI